MEPVESALEALGLQLPLAAALPLTYKSYTSHRSHLRHHHYALSVREPRTENSDFQLPCPNIT